MIFTQTGIINGHLICIKDAQDHAECRDMVYFRLAGRAGERFPPAVFISAQGAKPRGQKLFSSPRAEMKTKGGNLSPARTSQTEMSFPYIYYLCKYFDTNNLKASHTI